MSTDNFDKWDMSASRVPSTPSYHPPAHYPRPRPGTLTAAAVLAFILGGLGSILNVILLVTVANLRNAGGAIVVILLGVLLCGLLIAGGVRALSGSGTVLLVTAASIDLGLRAISLFSNGNGASIVGIIIDILIICFCSTADAKQWIASGQYGR